MQFAVAVEAVVKELAEDAGATGIESIEVLRRHGILGGADIRVRIRGKGFSATGSLMVDACALTMRLQMD